jgi:hypothetical protein
MIFFPTKIRVGGLEESDQIDLNNIYEEINKEDKDEVRILFCAS